MAEITVTGLALRELRESLGFTLSGMARHIGVRKTTIYRYEKEGFMPSLATLWRFASIAQQHRPDLCDVFLAPISKEFKTSVPVLRRAVDDMPVKAAA